jgi:minor extracellular serine protease Vpr
MKYFAQHLFIASTLLLLHSQASAQAQLSANLQQYLQTTDHSKPFANGVFSKQNGVVYLGALLKINANFKEAQLTQLGVLIGTKAGNILTAQIPDNKIAYVVKLKGIDYIQLDEPIAANLDIARKSSRVDSVQAEVNLPMAYSGKNVVVGIIDAGFDYTHPTFFDTTGTKLRIKRVWEQKNTGTPPAGFSYGNELTDTGAIFAKGTELATFTHGTHVGGIAAGSGYGSLNNSKHRGVAYESELVFVGIRPEKSEWKTMGMSSIIDGIQYVFNYAQSVGKPAVVNLSWGCSIGPNDGSSLFSQAVNNLLGPGRIFVLSAGNNGDNKIHLQKTFSTTDTLVNTFVTFPSINGEQHNWIDIWGDTAQQFCLNMALYTGTTKGAILPTFCLSNETKDTFLIGTDMDTCWMTVTTVASDYNQKPHILIDLYNKTTDKLNIGLEATSGTIDMWQGYVNDYNGYYGAFSNNNQSWAVNGDEEYTLGEMASTKDAITVAAYASKISFKNLQGLTQSYSGYAITNQIVPFSSHGPTADGRVKPDIAAPGMTLASSVNSFDVSYATGGGNYGQSIGVYTWPRNNRNYYYAEASGTSMSSPMASGIVALLLQVNPSLSPQRIKDILYETVIKDNFTTPTPNTNRWGAGKINAYGAIQKAILSVGVNTITQEVANTIRVYPNPSAGHFQLGFESNLETNLVVSVTNVIGQTIETELWSIAAGINRLDFNIEDAPKGIYFITIGGAGVHLVKKLIKE